MPKCLKLSNDVTFFSPFLIKFCLYSIKSEEREGLAQDTERLQPLISESETSIGRPPHYISPWRPTAWWKQKTSLSQLQDIPGKHSYAAACVTWGKSDSKKGEMGSNNHLNKWLSHIFSTILVQVVICSEHSALLISVCHYELGLLLQVK